MTCSWYSDVAVNKGLAVHKKSNVTCKSEQLFFIFNLSTVYYQSVVLVFLLRAQIPLQVMTLNVDHRQVLVVLEVVGVQSHVVVILKRFPNVAHLSGITPVVLFLLLKEENYNCTIFYKLII